MNNNANSTRNGTQSIMVFATDIACIMLSYYLSGYIWLMWYKNFDKAFAMNQLNDSLITVIIAVLITTIFVDVKPDFVVRGKFIEFRSILFKITIFAAIIAVYELFKRDDEMIPRGIYVVTVMLSVILMYITRQLVKRYLLRVGRHSKSNTLRVVAVTTRDRADKIITGMNKRSDWNRRISALVIVDEDLVGTKIRGVTVGANADTMMDYIKKEVVDEVYLDLGFATRGDYKKDVLELEDMGITVHLRLEMLETFNDFDSSIGTIGNLPVVTFTNRYFDYKELMVKRLIDIVGSLVGIVFMLLALVIVGPLIKLESPGPVFFKQKRVGKNGRFFYIYKFRSMCADAEQKLGTLQEKNEMDGLVFKMENDPRITKIGRFIRKTSIDELPQFINILKGDMSLVGTRPPTVEEFNRYEGHHKRRLSMKPGLTGMWQAYGRNTVTDFEEIVKMDLEYIDNWNLILDIKILGKTVATLFSNKGK